MPEQFDIYEYARYLRRRWRFLAIACGTAMAMALAGSLLLSKQYTATATLLIDAPAGADPRASTAVSPIYLESLKSYEQFAESDSLFLQALDKFHLRDQYPAAAPDRLRRRVLNVTKPRDTRILQISATLRDPVKAQALAQYIAEQTVNVNRTLSRQSDQELIEDGQRQLDTLRNRLRQVETTVRNESEREPYEALQADLDNLVELRARVQRDLMGARADVADYTAQSDERDLSAVRARAGVLEKQLTTLDGDIESKSKRIARIRTRSDELNAELKSLRSTLQLAENRLNELQSSVGIRNERLRIIDPGIVPQRPSAPDIPLNVLAAGLIAAVLCWLYLTVAYNIRAPRRNPVRAYSVER